MKLLAAAAFLSLTLLLAACDDDDAGDDATPEASPSVAATEPPTEPPTTPSPESSPTAMAVACPVTPQSVCDFALELREAVRAQDVERLVEFGQAQEFTCSEEQGQLDPLAPLCEGAEPGAMRTGYQFARLQSEGAVVPREGLRQALQQFFAERPQPVELATIGCPPAGEQGLNCEQRFGVVFAGENELIMFVAEPAGEQTQVTLYVTGVTAINQALVTGGTADFSLEFESASPPARFVPFEPQP